MTATALTIRAHAALEMLDGLISYRQLDYWLRCGIMTIAVPATHSGTGGARGLSLIDVLRFRAMGHIINTIGRSCPLRDMAWEVNVATADQLTSSLNFTEGRLTMSIDLTLDRTEKALMEWVAAERPGDPGPPPQVTWEQSQGHA